MNMFYRGAKVEVLGKPMDNHVWVRVVSKGGSPLEVGHETVVYENNVQPCVEDVFKIGEAVETKNTFSGIVVGYEFENNYAVCISDRISHYKNDRTRYSYGVNELRRK